MDDRMQFRRLIDDIIHARRIYSEAKSTYMLLKNIDSYANYKKNANMYNSYVQELQDAAARSAEIAYLVRNYPQKIEKVEEPLILEAEHILLSQSARLIRLGTIDSKISVVKELNTNSYIKDKVIPRIKAQSESLKKINAEINKKENLSMVYFLNEDVYMAYREFDDKCKIVENELKDLIPNVSKSFDDIDKEI